MQIRKEIRSAFPLFCVVLAAFFAGCFADPLPPGDGSAGATAQGGAPDASGGSDVGATGGAPLGDAGEAQVDPHCTPAVGEALPQRSSILSVTVQPTEREVQVRDIYDLFSGQCKGCHVEQPLGNFVVSDKDYVATLQNPEILKRLQSDDLTIAMPSPAIVPYSKRPPGDVIRQLVQLLTEWKAAGYPPDVFLEKLPKDASASPYALSTDQGLDFTNMGTCVPTTAFAFASDKDTMKALDADFASRMRAVGDDAAADAKIGLPDDLSETDLTSLDSAVLARRGVLSFVPTYPLWSDDAGKQRYVRVPLGKSITFDAATQRFNIPDNTRFYKTFMKKVTDVNGKERWRKLETRLIVARHDAGNTSDVGYQPQSLFGSYEWDETETHATLLRTTLRNGDPFEDHLFLYVEDEPAAAAIRAKNPANLTYELEYSNAARHWAVPGSQRCIHCHEGSENDNFIIGFTPLQLNSRKLGEGGVYEGGTGDQLNQLQRLIDFGVITGMKDASQVIKLEETQAGATPPRASRNDYELKAQAYMLGNCSHCHNPNGFPSVTAKELKDTLNFYPGKRPAETVVGGIFQFPLEKYSPRIKRGDDNSDIPYITPSLRDISGPPDTYLVKYSENTDENSSAGTQFENVPWRSLIYRNVQTPFTYADSATLYPHMPFDTGGFDCRAPQWLGQWMVSIPAKRKFPDLGEDYQGFVGSVEDRSPQPYEEVRPGEDGYSDALAAAKARLAVIKKDAEFNFCPDNSDIVDKDVLEGRFPTPQDRNKDGVPDHANWVVTDLTERKGLWIPRRTDWQDVLVNHNFPPPAVTDPDGAKLDAQKAIVDQLGSVHLSDVTASDNPYFSQQKFPLALWQVKPGCNFGSSIRRVKDFTGTQRPQWFDKTNPDPEAPVFDVAPGRAIFDMICINCHGPNADSLGRQADTLQNLTGGTARVANFRFGLFNPTPADDPYDKPDLGTLLNRQRVFGPVAGNGVSADDWGARYLAWMALGGTGVDIPSIILEQVARTEVAGVPRPYGFGITSANMLQVALAACEQVLAQGAPFGFDDRKPHRVNTPLIFSNGDAELWENVCSLHNTSHVMVVEPSDLDPKKTTVLTFNPIEPCDGSGLPAGCYPSDAFVGDERGHIIQGLHADNTFPWCLHRGGHDLAALQTFAEQYGVNGQPLPICPAEVSDVSSADSVADALAWQRRGAINAGLNVFEFLDSYIKSGDQHIGYDQCELLTE